MAGMPDGQRQLNGGENAPMRALLWLVGSSALLATGCASEKGIIDMDISLILRHRAQAAHPRIKVPVIHHYTAENPDARWRR